MQSAFLLSTPKEQCRSIALSSELPRAILSDSLLLREAAPLELTASAMGPLCHSMSVTSGPSDQHRKKQSQRQQGMGPGSPVQSRPQHPSQRRPLAKDRLGDVAVACAALGLRRRRRLRRVGVASGAGRGFKPCMCLQSGSDAPGATIRNPGTNCKGAAKASGSGPSEALSTDARWSRPRRSLEPGCCRRSDRKRDPSSITALASEAASPRARRFWTHCSTVEVRGTVAGSGLANDISLLRRLPRRRPPPREVLPRALAWDMTSRANTRPTGKFENQKAAKTTAVTVAQRTRVLTQTMTKLTPDD